MKIVVAAMGKTVAGHFGHCENFLFFEIEDGKITKETSIPSPEHRHGFLPDFLADKGAEVVIAGGMGGGATEGFKAHGIKVIVGAEGDARECVLSYLSGKLVSNESVCHAHEHAHECHGHRCHCRGEEKKEELSADEIKRVKGLGCLRDKRYPDVFNVRVITRNGKISVNEHRAVADAAELFGAAEVAMTSRLTLEIQGVKYENIEPLIAFLKERGLETGGTGPLVRPIVSCKGTTCQYGLIDTFGLSEKIHERFYKGYHSVPLPHKFKIAVGGCPNNCVKPDLNDLGVIGQRVPVFDLDRCRGCKVCQVEKACPIKALSLVDEKLRLDSKACNGCGRCKGKCPFGVTESYVCGWKITVGGRWGKKVAIGRALSKIFTDEGEVLDAIERAILLFKNEGVSGERFADTVERLGFDYVEKKILGDE